MMSVLISVLYIVFELLCIDVLLMKYVEMVFSLLFILVEGEFVVEWVVVMMFVKVYIRFISMNISSLMWLMFMLDRCVVFMLLFIV